MRMTSKGLQRNRKAKDGNPVTYFGHEENVVIDRQPNKRFGSVRVSIRNDRNYKLILEGHEVIMCLLEMDLNDIPDTIRILVETCPEIIERLPELMKQLAAGLLPKAPSN